MQKKKQNRQCQYNFLYTKEYNKLEFKKKRSDK
jgi:hypothetical protein